MFDILVVMFVLISDLVLTVQWSCDLTFFLGEKMLQHRTKCNFCMLPPFFFFLFGFFFLAPSLPSSLPSPRSPFLSFVLIVSTFSFFFFFFCFVKLSQAGFFPQDLVLAFCWLLGPFLWVGLTLWVCGQCHSLMFRGV